MRRGEGTSYFSATGNNTRADYSRRNPSSCANPNIRAHNLAVVLWFPSEHIAMNIERGGFQRKATTQSGSDIRESFSLVIHSAVIHSVYIGESCGPQPSPDTSKLIAVLTLCFGTQKTTTRSVNPATRTNVRSSKEDSETQREAQSKRSGKARFWKSVEKANERRSNATKSKEQERERRDSKIAAISSDPRVEVEANAATPASQPAQKSGSLSPLKKKSGRAGRISSNSAPRARGGCIRKSVKLKTK